MRIVTVLGVSEALTASLWFGVLIGHVEASFRNHSEPQIADKHSVEHITNRRKTYMSLVW